MYFPKSQNFPNCSWDNFSNGKRPFQSAIPAAGSSLFFLQLRKICLPIMALVWIKFLSAFQCQKTGSSSHPVQVPFHRLVLESSVWLKVIHKMKMYWWEFRLSPGKIRKVLSRPHGRDFGNSVSATHHTHLATNTPTLSNTQTQRRWLLAGSWRGQNCLSRMAAHGLFLSSFLPADQNNKLSECDGENLHFNIPQISVCSSATRAAVYAAK